MNKKEAIAKANWTFSTLHFCHHMVVLADYHHWKQIF